MHGCFLRKTESHGEEKIGIITVTHGVDRRCTLVVQFRSAARSAARSNARTHNVP